MTTLLQINAGPRMGSNSSSDLVERLAQRLRRSHPGSRLIVRDLGRKLIPALQGQCLAEPLSQPDHQWAGRQASVTGGDELIAELKSADMVVLALPAQHFAEPLPLKAWFEQIVRAGLSFQARSKGTKGLAGTLKFYIVAASGGFHKGGARDTQTLYVRHFLNFIGIHDVEFIYAESLHTRAAVAIEELVA